MMPSDPSPDRTAPSWTVYRQDDHGSRFIVATGLTRQDAERMVAEYEARGHKQLYWAQAQHR